VERRVRGDNLLVNIDPTQLQQAVLNLGLNARDAMPDGGVLRLEAEIAHIDHPEGLPLVRGSYVRLRVRDTGTGIAKHAREHIFEPFFTTKAPGLGTGLGLSNVRATAEGAGGCVAVESELGQGATFTLYLPLTTESRVSGVEQRPHGQARPSAANVLVVDSEPQIRDVVCAMLKANGYDACTADSAREALARVQAGKVDLLCIDAMLPDMSGERLLDQVRRSHPRLPVVVCSAFGTDEGISRHLARGHVVFLSKPFSRKELLSGIERACEGGRESTPPLHETPTG
jgi:CheY-like chemotaxis protein